MHTRNNKKVEKENSKVVSGVKPPSWILELFVFHCSSNATHLVTDTNKICFIFIHNVFLFMAIESVIIGLNVFFFYFNRLNNG